MPINFNIDLSARRKQQQALAELEKQRLQAEALRQSAFGQQEAGPPTRFGETSVSGGQLAPNAFVEQLFGNLATAPEGIKQTLGLLEKQRLADQAQRDLAQQQQEQATQSAQITSAFSGLPTEGRPGIAALVEGAKLPGKAGDEFRKRLAEGLLPQTLGAEQSLVTPFGGKVAGLEPGDMSPKEKRAAESVLGNQFKTDTRLFSAETDAMSKIRELGFNSAPTAATDNSLIFQYARLQSPGIVTKDDFEQARTTGGLPASVVGFMNKMVNGELPPDIRSQLVQAAALQYKGVADNYESRYKGFKELAEIRNLDPRKVLGSGRIKTKFEDLLSLDPTTGLLAAPPPPPPGTTVVDR